MQVGGVRGPASDVRTPPGNRAAIRVLVADDREDVRTGLTDLLHQHRDIRVVAACADGDEVLPAAERTIPDVALLDLSMPRRHGLAAARDLRVTLPAVRVLILSCSADAAAIRAAQAVGAVGYLLKCEDSPAIAGSLRAVARGGSAWDPRAARALAAIRPRTGPGHSRP